LCITRVREADGQARMKDHTRGSKCLFCGTDRKWQDQEWKYSTMSTVKLITFSRDTVLCSAGQYFKDHWNELGPETAFVQMSKPGDRVVLWARALFPVSSFSSVSIAESDVQGWQNNVR